MSFSGCLPSGGQHFHVIIFPGIIHAHCMQYAPTAQRDNYQLLFS